MNQTATETALHSADDDRDPEREFPAVARRVLIVEDNEMLARGLRGNLEFEGYTVRLAPDAATGLALVREQEPDLLILDLMLPDMDGYRVLRALREEGYATPVLVLTALADEADKVRGFRFGADDYVTKPFGLMELIARVDALLRRATTSSARASDRPAAPSRNERARYTFGDITIDTDTHTVLRASQCVALRPKEYDLLLALLQRDGRIATRLELLHDVWGYDDTVQSRTVDTHVGELRRKLESDPANPKHILTVRKTGYRLDVGASSVER